MKYMTMDTPINLFHQSSYTRMFDAGEVILKEGERDSVMYVIQSGEVDIVRDGVTITTLREGHLLGELSAITLRPHVTSAIARTDGVLAAIDKDTFNYLVDHSPRFVHKLLHVISERLQNTWQIVELH